MAAQRSLTTNSPLTRLFCQVPTLVPARTLAARSFSLASASRILTASVTSDSTAMNPVRLPLASNMG